MTPPVVTGYEWGLALRNRFPRPFFDVRALRAAQMKQRPQVENGQLWYVFFEGAHARLFSHDKSLQCDGIIEDGHWVPMREAPAAPMMAYLYLTHSEHAPDVKLSIGNRPGIILDEPLSGGDSRLSLYRHERALWIRGESNRKKGALHGEVSLRGKTTGKAGHYHVWTAWGLSCKPEENLVCRAQDRDLANCKPLPSHHRREASHAAPRDLLECISTLMCEFLDLANWSDPGPERKEDLNKIQRGEIVLVRFGITAERIPCLVVSPSKLHVYREDAVLLQCIPYERGDESRPLVVPLNDEFLYDDHSWSVGLSLVRGIAFSKRFVRRFSPPKYCYKFDPDAFRKVNIKLGEIYA